MKGNWRNSLGTALACTALLVVSASQGFADERVELRHATGLNPTYPLAAATTRFNEAIAEASGGEIEVKMFWGGSLGGFKEALDLASKGAADITDIVPGYFGSQLPLKGMTNAIPHTFFEPKQAMYALMELSETNADQIAEYERNNIKPLIYRYLGNYHFLCTEKVETLADLKGKKVRSFGSFIPKMFEELGIIPVNVIVTDAYEAMKRGSLDCNYASWNDHANWKHYEVAKYLVNVPMGGIAAYTDSINLDTFNALSPEHQQILVDAGREATDWMAERTDATLKASLQEMLDNGVELVEFQEVDELRAAVPDMVSLWKEFMVSRDVGDEAAAYADELMNAYNRRIAN